MEHTRVYATGCLRLRVMFSMSKPLKEEKVDDITRRNDLGFVRNPEEVDLGFKKAQA